LLKGDLIFPYTGWIPDITNPGILLVFLEKTKTKSKKPQKSNLITVKD